MSTWGFKGFKNRGLELPDGDLVEVSPAGRARLRFNLATLAVQVSLSGAPYVDIGGGGSGGGWVDTGTVVRLNTITDQVVIGALTPIGTEDLRVAGDTLLQGTVEVGSAITTQVGSGNDLALSSDSGIVTIEVAAATASAFSVFQGGNLFLDLDTTALAERWTFGAGGTPASVTINIPDNAASGFLIRQGLNAYFLADSSDTAERVVIGNATGTAPQLFLEMRDDLVDAMLVRQAGNVYLAHSTDNGAERTTYGNDGATTPQHHFFLNSTIAPGTVSSFRLRRAGSPDLDFFGIDAAVGFEGIQIGSPAVAGVSDPLIQCYLLDNWPEAFSILHITAGPVTNFFVRCDTTDGAEQTILGNSGAPAVVSPRLTILLKDNDPVAMQALQGLNSYFLIETTTAGEQVIIGQAPAGVAVLLGTTTSIMGFYGGAGTTRMTFGADLTNAVTAGGVDNTIADYAIVDYATDAATIRNNQYQLARSLKILQDWARASGMSS